MDRRSCRIRSAKDTLLSVRALVSQGVWQRVFETLAAVGGPPAEVLLDSTHVKAQRCAAGGKGGFRAQALGVSRGGRTTKIHALSDGQGRPLAFLLTGGRAADSRAAESLLHGLAPSTLVMADRAYDTNAVRQQIEDQGAVPNIRPKRTRRWKSCFSPALYRGRNGAMKEFGVTP